MKNFVVLVVCFLFGIFFLPTNSQNFSSVDTTTVNPEVHCVNFTSCEDCVNNGCTYEVNEDGQIQACKADNETTAAGVEVAHNVTECNALPTPPPLTTTVEPANITTPATNTTTSTMEPTTTEATTVPTTVTPSTSPSPTTTPATTPVPTTTIPTEGPTAEPSHDRRFDAPSFIGGIVLTLGTMAIGFVAFKFYKARTERNYHTL